MRQGDGLPAVLVGGDLRNDLGRDVAGGGEAVRLLDQRPGDDGAVLQHVLQVHQIAVVHVLGIVIGVMEMDDALAVRLGDILGQKHAHGQVLRHLARHVVALGGVDDRILVGVLLLGLLIGTLDEAEDLVVRRIGLAHQGAGIAVGDVALGHLESAVGHDLLFHHVLHLFHARRAAQQFAGGGDLLGHLPDIVLAEALAACGGLAGLGNGGADLAGVKLRLGPVSLDDLHSLISPGSLVSCAAVTFPAQDFVFSACIP